MGILMGVPSIDEIDKFVARLSDRQIDWGVLDFQARVNPKYRRAQMRYVGGGGTGQHQDPNIIKAGHFTLSTMILPSGHEGPLHLHSDVEELFFNVGVQMQWPFVAGRKNHRAEREMSRFNDVRVLMLSGSTTPNVPHLSSAILRVHPGLKIQYTPVDLPVAQTSNEFVDFVDAWNAH